jgi:hypothetical protein
MPIIDERGRVFGRLNLVDAAVGLLLLALLPAAYGSYLLFKAPAPRLTAVLPSSLRPEHGAQVEVRGENFRPYMRVSFNDAQGQSFLFYNQASAFVQLPDLPPGTYDVVLYDYMQEVSRLPAAFTSEPKPAPPKIVLEVSGLLTSLTTEQVKILQPGLRLHEPVALVAAEVISVGRPEPQVLRIQTGDASAIAIPVVGTLQVPVRMRIACVVEMNASGVRHCAVNGIPLVGGANVPYQGIGAMLNLQVSEVAAPGR